jgi:adhesin/invasin
VSAPAVSAATTPLGSISTGSTLTILANQPATITIVSGNDQAEPSGNGAAPFTVQVSDATGQPLPNVTVTFAVTSGSLTFTNGTAVTSPAVPTVTIVTDVNGQAALTATFGMTLGPGTLTATTGNLTPITFNFTTGTLSTNISTISGDNQSAAPYAAFSFPLTVQISQANGSPAPYANITWSLLSGVSVMLGATTGAADSSGMASITVTAGPIPGVAQILATTGAAGAPATVTFTLTVTGTASGPSNVVIMNAADYSTSIGIGSLVSIFGSDITDVITGVDTNPTDLANFTLTFNGVAAPILALVNQNGVQQINAEVPFEITSGTNPVVLQTPEGQVSLPNQIVNTDAPGIFSNGSIAVNGTNYPLVSATRQDGSYVSSSNPALPGDTITFYATGLGQTIPTVFTGQPGVPGELVAEPVYAAINNQGVQVVSAEYTPGMLGLYTIVIQVPQNVIPGAADSLTIFSVDPTGAAYTSLAVYIPVQ